MTRIVSFARSAAMTAGLVALVAAGSAGAQQPAGSWRGWLGCWTAGPAIGGISPSEVAPLVCIAPTADASVVEVTTISGDKVVSTQSIDAGGRELPLDAKGCTGTQRAQWSADGRRVYLKAVAKCDGVERVTSGIIAMSPAGEWLDVQGVAAEGDEGVRVARYRDAGVPSAVPEQIAAALRERGVATQGARRNAETARFGQRATPGSTAPAPQPVAKAVPPPPAPSGVQDLKRIRLVDAGIESRLNALGVERYDQIAAWTREDVKRVSQALGLKGRINQENWIEQALILAKGGETHYSARRARGEAPTATPTPDEGESPAPSSAPLPRPMSRAGVSAAVVSPPPMVGVRPATAAVVPLTTAPMVAERAAFANRTVADPVQPALEDATLDVVPVVPVRPVTAERDNLQRIGGVTPQIEQGLNAQGVSRYSQIAQWSPSDIERFEKQLLTGGRIARENWVEQAQILSRGGDTRFSRAFDYPQGAEPRSTGVGDASREQPAARTDLGSLRSVRSRAYQGAPEPGPEAAQRAAAQNKVMRASSSHDLKRIRGIGVLIERKLNSMGVTTYDHIANWTADDIDRVSQSLDFKGRIERENWVEQARILSAGGQTEFSRRVDRGEVETSRTRT